MKRLLRTELAFPIFCAISNIEIPKIFNVPNNESQPNICLSKRRKKNIRNIHAIEKGFSCAEREGDLNC